MVKRNCILVCLVIGFGLCLSSASDAGIFHRGRVSVRVRTRGCVACQPAAVEVKAVEAVPPVVAVQAPGVSVKVAAPAVAVGCANGKCAPRRRLFSRVLVRVR